MPTEMTFSESERVRLLVLELDRLMPGFAAATLGATDAEIAELQELADRPLPDAYLAFLRVAGSAWGTGDPRIYESRFTAAAVIEYWCDLEWPLPLRFIPFAKCEMDPYYDLYLDLEQPGTELALVRFPEPDTGESFETVAGDFSLMELSFTGMLFTRTWLDYCLPQWPCRGAARSKRSVGELESASSLLHSQGWIKNPLSTGWSRLYEREGSAALVHEWYGSAPLHLRVTAAKVSDCDRIIQELAGALRLDVYA